MWSTQLISTKFKKQPWSKYPTRKLSMIRLEGRDLVEMYFDQVKRVADENNPSKKIALVLSVEEFNSLFYKINPLNPGCLLIYVYLGQSNVLDLIRSQNEVVVVDTLEQAHAEIDNLFGAANG